MFKTVVFDLDGTILDTIEDLSCALNGALTECGYPTLPVRDIQTMVGNGTDALMRQALAKCGHQAQDEEKLKSSYLPKYYANQRNKTRPYPGILSLLDELRKYQIKAYVYSNKPDFLTQEIVLHFFGHRFAGVLGQKPGAKPKPDAGPLLEMLAQQKVDLRTAVFVGDSNVDIFTGQNAGLKTIGVAWGFRSVAELVQSGANFIAETPEEILAICRK
ncbi:MAG: HAD family hydrolase [Firmicutes bacterium]|nr:HAD family hydrolase [Bacillota bacterium]